jgi:DNA-binding XRE family transcriptional regulator
MSGTSPDDSLGRLWKILNTKATQRGMPEQHHAALMAEFCGVSPISVRRWRTGRREPGWYNIEALVRAFHLTSDDLFWVVTGQPTAKARASERPAPRSHAERT